MRLRGWCPVYSRRLLRVFSILTLLLLVVGLCGHYFQLYEKRLDTTRSIAVSVAYSKAVSLKYSGTFVARFKADLAGAGCGDPYRLYRENPARMQYYLHHSSVLADYLLDLDEALSIMYVSSGIEKPWKLDMALSGIRRFFVHLYQDTNLYMVKRQPVNCSNLPSNETLNELDRVFQSLSVELGKLSGPDQRFIGLNETTIDTLYRLAGILSNWRP